jgi:hypothetical protein
MLWVLDNVTITLHVSFGGRFRSARQHSPAPIVVKSYVWKSLSSTLSGGGALLARSRIDFAYSSDVRRRIGAGVKSAAGVLALVR